MYNVFVAHCAGYFCRCSQGPDLDDAAAVAAAVPAAVVDGLGAAGGALPLSGPEETDEGRGEEENGAEESKSNGGLELATLVAVDRVDVAPVEDVATAVANKLL